MKTILMKTFFSRFILFVIAIAIFTGCDKNLGGNPRIEFFTDNGYIYENDSIVPGIAFLVGLKCTWNGVDPLVSINIFLNDVPQDTIEILSPDSEGVGYGLEFEKTAAEKDSLVFELKDSQGQMASLNLVLYSDTASTDVKKIAGIILGAQTSINNRLHSISNLKSYSLTKANEDEAIQKVIDLVGAYNSDNNRFIGSPATNFNDIYDFSTRAETDRSYFAETDYADKIYGVLNKTKIKDTLDIQNILDKRFVDKKGGLLPGRFIIGKIGFSL